MKIQETLANLKRRFPNEPEYHQAVEEVLTSIEEVYNQHPEFEKANLVERLCIPDRIYSFRVTWVTDKGTVCTNMGYRVQHSNALGPYKGGLRFHNSVSPSILKFLAFEQTFKNALTTLPMGGGKGGSDFSPRGKSNAEIMQGIHEQCVKYGTEPDGCINYVKGANVAGFMKVAQATIAQGIL